VRRILRYGRHAAYCGATTAVILTFAGMPAGAASNGPKCAGKVATIVGTGRSESGARKIRGTPSADVIVARGGNDRVLGRGGGDTICGGRGNDQIFGGRGNDRLIGGPGSDTCDGGAGTNIVIGCEEAAPPTPPVTPSPGPTPPVTPPPAPNDQPPTAAPDSASVNEDAGPTAIDVLANDGDPDGGPKTIQSAADPAHGTVVVAGDGLSLSYQPDPDFCNAPPGTSPDTFTYTLNGGSQALVSVAVNCVNDAPTAVDDAASTPKNTTLLVSESTLTANDTDADGDSLMVTGVQNPSHGTVFLGGGNVSFQPDTDYCGSASFEYVVSDGSLTDVGLVDVTVC
jgi:Ca2+-binding RTX toxin-like protein